MGRVRLWCLSKGSKNYHVMNAGLLLGHVLIDLLLGGRCFHGKTIILNSTVTQQRCGGGPRDHHPGPFKHPSRKGGSARQGRSGQLAVMLSVPLPQHQGSAGKAVCSAFFSPFRL